MLLLATVSVAGCVGPYTPPPPRGYLPPPPVPGGPPGHPPGHPPAPGFVQRQTNPNRVAILLPLTGANGDIGQAMLHAAQLALPEGGTPVLDARDTGGTPDGAARAAQEAIAAGAGLILGPLTSAETAAVAPVARDAGVAVLAFTNDPHQAQPGVWTMGITPTEQVRRLLIAAQSQNKGHAAALLPNTDFGHALGDALTQAAASLNLPAPDVRYHETGMGAINTAVRDLSNYGGRRGPIEAQIKASRLLGTPEGRHRAQELARAHIPPPPFDTLLLGDTGEALTELATMLPYYDVDPGAVQILGPAQWLAPGSGANTMTGAWYAAPDPASRSAFEADYAAKNGGPPPAIADLAFDAAAAARALSTGQGGFSFGALTQPAGFAGADGWFVLLPDGEVRRGLAVFRLDRGGASMMEPAPARTPGT